MTLKRLEGQDALLVLERVGKTYAEGTEALGEIDLSINAGSITALLGPSGCGKSTALRLIAGLDQPTLGTIRWPRLSGGAPKAGDIGFVFQDPTLMPWASVGDNVALPLALTGAQAAPGSVAAGEVDALLLQVGLHGFKRALPRTLSGGMRMRVSLARALVTSPSVLLLDEPFAALDEITRFGLNDALLALKSMRELTILFVTHSVFESVYLSDRIIVMSPRPGRIAAEFDVNAPQDRAAGFRHSAQYAQQCQRVSHALAAAMEQAR